MAPAFRIARNPDPGSTLPYVLRVPVGTKPLVLEARDTWPRTAKVYCHRGEWPDDARTWRRSPRDRACAVVSPSTSCSTARARIARSSWSPCSRAAARASSGTPRRPPARPARACASVPIVFCENRQLAQEWAYRFLGAAARYADEERVEL